MLCIWVFKKKKWILLNLEFFFCIGYRGCWVVFVVFGFVNEYDENSYKGDFCNSWCNCDINYYLVDNKNFCLENKIL